MSNLSKEITLTTKSQAQYVGLHMEGCGTVLLLL